MPDVETNNDRKIALDEARRGENTANIHHADQSFNNLPQKNIENNNTGQTENNPEGEHKEKLDNLRRSGKITNIKNALKSAKSTATTVRAVVFAFAEVNLLLDIPFFAALGGAILKDILDLVTFETIVLPWLFGLLCSIFIFMMLLVAGAGGKRKVASKLVQKGLLIIGGGLLDGIPGLDLIPIETATVLVVYIMTLKERAEEKIIEEENVALQGA